MADDPKTLEDLEREFEQISEMIQTSFENMSDFIVSINNGTFHKAPDELKQKKRGRR